MFHFSLTLIQDESHKEKVEVKGTSKQEDSDSKSSFPLALYEKVCRALLETVGLHGVITSHLSSP